MATLSHRTSSCHRLSRASDTAVGDESNCFEGCFARFLSPFLFTNIFSFLSSSFLYLYLLRKSRETKETHDAWLFRRKRITSLEVVPERDTRARTEQLLLINTCVLYLAFCNILRVFLTQNEKK